MHTSKGLGVLAGTVPAAGVGLGRLLEVEGQALGMAHGMALGARRAVRGLLSTAGAVLMRLRSHWEAARGAAACRRRMRVVESLALGGRRQLLLVRCDDQEYLVGTGPDSVETIVLRQPGEALPQKVEQPGPLPAASTRPLSGSMRPTWRASTRAAAMYAERPAPGPWLVTREAAGAARNLVPGVEGGREAGRGQELWQ